MAVQALLDSQPEPVRSRIHILDSLASCYPGEVANVLVGPTMSLITRKDSFGFVVNTAAGQRTDDKDTNAHWVSITLRYISGSWLAEIRCSLGRESAEVEMTSPTPRPSPLILGSTWRPRLSRHSHSCSVSGAAAFRYGNG